MTDRREGSTSAAPIAPANAQLALAGTGLVYSNEGAPGITRRLRRGKFIFFDPSGKQIRAADTVARIRALAIPPAYGDVWISPEPNGHIQATGRDAKGRKQYRYHAAFRQHREAAKFEHMLEFVAALPAIREHVTHDLACKGLPREKVLATVVRLLEITLIRVGNDDYARQNGSYGLTTLRDRHVHLEGTALRFRFKGKSGKEWNLQIRDRRISRIVRSCQELPGQKLFQYVDDSGEVRDVSSADVNSYLRDITGHDITAKDFRTWAGTVLAALALRAFETVDSQARLKANIRIAIEKVSTRLGNTPSICRKCYVHPEVLDAYLGGSLLLEIREEVDETLKTDLTSLSAEEAAVLALLRQRLQSEPVTTS